MSRAPRASLPGTRPWTKLCNNFDPSLQRPMPVLGGHGELRRLSVTPAGTADRRSHLGALARESCGPPLLPGTPRSTPRSPCRSLHRRQARGSCASGSLARRACTALRRVQTRPLPLCPRHSGCPAPGDRARSQSEGAKLRSPGSLRTWCRLTRRCSCRSTARFNLGLVASLHSTWVAHRPSAALFSAAERPVR